MDGTTFYIVTDRYVEDIRPGGIAVEPYWQHTGGICIFLSYEKAMCYKQALELEDSSKGDGRVILCVQEGQQIILDRVLDEVEKEEHEAEKAENIRIKDEARLEREHNEPSPLCATAFPEYCPGMNGSHRFHGVQGPTFSLQPSFDIPFISGVLDEAGPLGQRSTSETKVAVSDSEPNDQMMVMHTKACAECDSLHDIVKVTSAVPMEHVLVARMDNLEARIQYLEAHSN